MSVGMSCQGGERERERDLPGDQIGGLFLFEMMNTTLFLRPRCPIRIYGSRVGINPDFSVLYYIT